VAIAKVLQLEGHPTSRQSFRDINPGSWKCLIFIILPVINDKIRITKDGWQLALGLGY